MRSNQKFFFLKSQDELGSNVLALETHTFNLLSGNGKTFSLKKMVQVYPIFHCFS